MEEIEFISPFYDSTFKYLWKDESTRPFIKKLLKLITNLDIDDYVLYDPELNNGEKFKDYRLDLLFTKKEEANLSSDIINIEMYKNYNKFNDIKSHTYLFKLASYGYEKGEKYKVKHTVQINFKNYINKEIPGFDICCFMLRDKDNKYSFDDLAIYDIYLPHFKGVCYNDDNELAGMLSLLNAESFEEMRKLSAGNEEASIIVKKLENLMKDPDFRGLLEDENVRKKVLNSVKEESFEEGLEQGIEKTKIEIAKNMLSGGMDIDCISEMTNLSKEEIEKIKNNSL